MMKNAHEFAGLHEELGIDLNKLGCLMLETENPLTQIVRDDISYASKHPDRFWIKGLQTDWHVTIRYGFMPNVRQRHVEQVLQSVEIPKMLKVSHLEVFGSPFPDEPYKCIVARVEDEALNDINAQLSVLPNVNTYVEYKPHVTIGYFRAEAITDSFLEQMERILRHDVATGNLDYGHILTKEG